MKKLNKLMAALLALAMCLSLLPMSAFAAVCVHWDVKAAKSTWETVSITPATCAENAVEHQECSNCGATRDHEVLLSAKGHDWEFVSCAKELYTSLCTAAHQDLMRCKTCGKEEKRLNSHSHHFVITGDVVDPGDLAGYDFNKNHTVKCTECTAVEIRDHHFAPATCTEPAKCECGKVELNSTPLGHNPEHHDAVPATCTTAGNIEYWSCDRCGKNFSDAACTTAVANVTDPVKGHDLTHHEAVAATCLHTGNNEYWSCSRCGKNFSDANGATEAANVTTPVNPNNHDAACKPVSRGHDASQHWNVRTCGAKDTYEAHQYHEGEHVCYVCGYDRTVPHVHASVSYVEPVTATCTVEAMGGYYTCSCGKYFSDEACTSEITDLNTLRGTTDPNNHTGVPEDWENKDADSHHKVCADCRNEAVVEGHTVVIDARVEPTYTSTGLTEGSHCSVCGAVLVAQTEIPMLSDDEPDDDEPEIDDTLIPLASGPITRAEFVNYLWEREDRPESDATTFLDVPEDHEYYDAIGWAQANKIAIGVDEKVNFQPDEYVTVAQVRLFLTRYAKYLGMEMPALTKLTGEDGEAVLNCGEIVAEFFGEEYTTGEPKEDAE